MSKYEKRLKWEQAEISGQNEWEYFADLVANKTRYPKNQNNLVVPYLLGIVSDFDIARDPDCVYGEFPDIDVDYLPVVRDYLKNVWAPKEFGEDKVCNISNYTTFGIKSALIDMARVHGESREDALELTKALDAKDEEGKLLTWESALKLYPDLAKYCEQSDIHKQIAEATKRLINRNRGMGVHAGGLIISSVRLDDFVPLVKRKDAPHASAWVEGLHGQDLQPVGLVKFDLLVISNLLQIAQGCKLAKERAFDPILDMNRAIEQANRQVDPTIPMQPQEALDLAHDITGRIKLKTGDGICALPGLSDWSDVDKWRNDPKALAMANSGDLKCIFQFDSEGIRALVREGGVGTFDDLVAYTALFRPGPLNMKMQERFILRKNGRETWYENLHPIMRPILGKTYGVMVYQEQVMQILNAVGDIPLKDCEAVRKAISKKKVEGFIKYKKMFLENGQRNLGISEEEVNNLWNQIEAFAEYGFNRSHAVAYTYISGRLLYLKAHFPAEFYAAILGSEDLSEKIKEYKIEAKLHDVILERVDINKSSKTFKLIGDKIYYGLSNVKGVGEAVAQRIVDGQPYSSFDDFLERFGTDASVVKALVGLRCWKGIDPVKLVKYADYYRERIKKEHGRCNRYVESIERYDQQLKELTLDPTATFDESLLPNWEKYDVDELQEEEVEESTITHEPNPSYLDQCRDFQENFGVPGPDEPVDDEAMYAQQPSPLISKTTKKKVKKKKVFNRYKEIVRLFGRRERSINQNARKNVAAEKKISFDTFDDSLVELEPEVVTELRNKILCEERYYGFAWESPLELSPDFKGNMTFEQFEGGTKPIAGVQVEIEKVEHKAGKKVEYKRLSVVDAHGKKAGVNVWMDDWTRWEPELQKGNLVRMMLKAPSGGFPTYSLDSVPKWQRHLLPKNKDDDYRVRLMRFGEPDEHFLTDEEVMDKIESDLGGK